MYLDAHETSGKSDDDLLKELHIVARKIDRRMRGS